MNVCQEYALDNKPLLEVALFLLIRKEWNLFQKLLRSNCICKCFPWGKLKTYYITLRGKEFALTPLIYQLTLCT